MHKKLLVISVIVGMAAQARVQEINPPLMVAAGQNQREKVEELLKNGAPIDEQNASGFTALIVAAELGHYDVAKLLIDRGANVNSASKGTRSSCTEQETPDLPVACASILPGQEPPYTVHVGWTALHYAVYHQDIKMISLLLNGGAHVNTDSARKTPLMLAAQQGDRALVTMLLNYGADVNAQNKVGRTALYYAVAYADKNTDAIALIQELISAGAHVTDQVKEVKNRRRNKAKIEQAFKFPLQRVLGGSILL